MIKLLFTRDLKYKNGFNINVKLLYCNYVENGRKIGSNCIVFFTVTDLKLNLSAYFRFPECLVRVFFFLQNLLNSGSTEPSLFTLLELSKKKSDKKFQSLALLFHPIFNYISPEAPTHTSKYPRPTLAPDESCMYTYAF